MEFGWTQARCCVRTPLPCSPLAPSPRKRGEGKLPGHGGSTKIRLRIRSAHLETEASLQHHQNAHENRQSQTMPEYRA